MAEQLKQNVSSRHSGNIVDLAKGKNYPWWDYVFNVKNGTYMIHIQFKSPGGITWSKFADWRKYGARECYLNSQPATIISMYDTRVIHKKMDYDHHEFVKIIQHNKVYKLFARKTDFWPWCFDDGDGVYIGTVKKEKQQEKHIDEESDAQNLQMSNQNIHVGHGIIKPLPFVTGDLVEFIEFNSDSNDSNIKADVHEGKILRMDSNQWTLELPDGTSKNYQSNKIVVNKKCKTPAAGPGPGAVDQTSEGAVSDVFEEGSMVQTIKQKQLQAKIDELADKYKMFEQQNKRLKQSKNINNTFSLTQSQSNNIIDEKSQFADLEENELNDIWKDKYDKLKDKYDKLKSKYDKLKYDKLKDKYFQMKNKTKSKLKKQHSALVNFRNEFDGLIKIPQMHLDYMEEQEDNVNKLIEKTPSLHAAKIKALGAEKELLKKILNLAEMNKFLNTIIEIENLFNSLYTEEQRRQQKEAIKTHGKGIPMYEAKEKPISEAASFVDLYFRATTVNISDFKLFIKEVEDKCKSFGITIIESSGAKGKKIERAFYKAYYIYSAQFDDDHHDDGYKQMTDILRCSFVFESFEFLYGCFGIIELLAAEHGGILRCKDRFRPPKVAFGYRDFLINVYCPGTKIVCEIQLHHRMFYDNKKISHQLYKLARLFDQNRENEAYNYADKHNRSLVGDKIYKATNNHDHLSPKTQRAPLSPVQESCYSENDMKLLLDKWNLGQYTQSLIDNGYDDIGQWKELTENDLMKINFKVGHAKRFVTNSKQSNS